MIASTEISRILLESDFLDGDEQRGVHEERVNLKRKGGGKKKEIIVDASSIPRERHPGGYGEGAGGDVIPTSARHEIVPRGVAECYFIHQKGTREEKNGGGHATGSSLPWECITVILTEDGHHQFAWEHGGHDWTRHGIHGR